MFKAFCDSDTCNLPIDPADNHLEIQGFTIVDDKKALQANGLHFCCKKCFDSWFVKNANRPRITTP